METGQYIQDGTVKWIITDIRDGDMVGDISLHPTLLAGHIKANRATVTASDYPRLLVWVQANNMLTTDSTDESKYLYDSENDLLTLPNVMDKVLQGGNAVEAKEAGLPNIKGTVGQAGITQCPFATVGSAADMLQADGVFQFTATNKGMDYDGIAYVNYNTNNGTGPFKIDASLSNPIYGNSTTVQSPAVTLIPQIKY